MIVFLITQKKHCSKKDDLNIHHRSEHKTQNHQTHA